MKRYLVLTVLVCLCCFGFKQQQSCKKFRNGTFRIPNKPRDYIITRKGAVQFEQLEGDTQQDKFLVKWLSDCVYTLTPSDEYLVRNPRFNKNSTLTVTITSVTDTSYMQTTTSNFSEGKSSSEVLLIKN